MKNLQRMCALIIGMLIIVLFAYFQCTQPNGFNEKESNLSVKEVNIGATCSSCGNPTWESSAVYTGGMFACYNSAVYKAKWWTLNNLPGSSSPWEYQSACGGGGTATPTPTPTPSGTATPTPTPTPTPSSDWLQANLTWYTSYPDEGSDECLYYNGCLYKGLFRAIEEVYPGDEGRQPESWVQANNIAAVHENVFQTYKRKTLRIKQGSLQIDAVVWDMCADSDCSGCCTANSPTGYMIDLESYTKNRFGSGSGVVEWMVINSSLAPIPTPTSGGTATATPTPTPTPSATATATPTPTPTSSSGGCSGVAAWDEALWGSYAVNDNVTSSGAKYRCHTLGWCQYDPAGAYGHYSWEFVENCQ